MEPTLFRRSLVRGMTSHLIRTGSIAFPSKEAADYASDYVADNSGMPDPFLEPAKITGKVAFELTDMLKVASERLCKQAGGYQPELTKSASLVTPTSAASEDCFALLQKVAYETEHPQNTEAQAAQHSEGAKMDLASRPEGYANTGVGTYIDIGKGAIGVEEPAARTDAVTGANSAVQNSMKSAAEGLARKIATTSYAGHGTTAGNAPNTLANAAKHDEGAELDQSQRPQGYANVGVNVSKFTVPPGAVIGHQEAIARPNHPSGSNTATKAASEQKTVKVAGRVIPFLFSDLKEAEKVAHVRALSGLTKAAQAQYLYQMYGAYGLEKSAAEQHALSYHKIASSEDDGDGDDGSMGPNDDAEVAEALGSAAKEIDAAKKHEEAEIASGEGKKEAAVIDLRAAISNIQR